MKTLGRGQWKKALGYHRQGRVKNAFFRYKSIIGDGLRARSPAGQGSEVVLGCEILNRMTALGRPVSYRIVRILWFIVRASEDSCETPRRAGGASVIRGGTQSAWCSPVSYRIGR